MQDVKQALDKDWYGSTMIHPLGLSAVLVLGSALVVLPRRWATLPLIAMACFISPAQRLVVFGADFTLLRILVVFGAIRILVRGEWKGFRWCGLDTAMAVMTVLGIVTFTALYGDVSALINRCGKAFDGFGTYLLFRALVRDRRDLECLVRSFVLVSIPVAAFFAVEYATGRNLFAIFGGVREITHIRGGRLRCQGAFAHPILAGCFWASVIPMVAVQWFRGGTGRILAVVGTFTALFIIFTCSSSTPVMAVAFGLLGASLYPLRHWMKWIVMGFAVQLVFLHFLMNKPVWHLLARITVFDSSTGWHRFKIIDEAVKHIGDWWLMGVTNTDSWGVWDITNEYVLTAIRGGLPTLLAFLAVIVLAFAGVTRLLRATEGYRYPNLLSWALGASLFIHLTSFIAVSYFGQIVMVWYLHLAVVGSLSAGVLAARRANPAPVRRAEQDRPVRIGWNDSLSPTS